MSAVSFNNEIGSRAVPVWIPSVLLFRSRKALISKRCNQHSVTSRKIVTDKKHRSERARQPTGHYSSYGRDAQFTCDLVRDVGLTQEG
ncbi:MAG TPA: hypothetical protein VNW97_18765 [Candidatus Saccharimonadales bacterium]|nr:hypothetical protein [Candidatus Saccharimonadales bacterium]